MERENNISIWTSENSFLDERLKLVFEDEIIRTRSHFAETQRSYLFPIFLIFHDCVGVPLVLIYSSLKGLFRF